MLPVERPVAPGVPPDRGPTARGAGRHGWLVAALLLLHLVQLGNLAVSAGETYDEPMYLLAGRLAWATGDVSFNREHPPLLKWLIGAPLALSGQPLPAHPHTDVATAQRFLGELGDDPLRTLRLGRLPMVLLGMALAVAVWAFARSCAGDTAGLAALAALMLQPALTGNTPLAALDAGAAAFAFFSLLALVRLRRHPGPGATLGAGLLLGAALLCKFTNLLLLPVFALLLLADAVRLRRAGPVLALAGVGLVALSTLFAGYGFELRRLADLEDHPRFAPGNGGPVLEHPVIAAVAGAFGDAPVPMPSLLEGLDATLTGVVTSGHMSYFRGETGAGRGWLAFYPVALAVKTPVGLLCLALLALGLLPWLDRSPAGEGPLLLFPLLVLVVFACSSAQLGVRYVLPACPAIAVLVGRLAAFDASRRRGALRLASVAALLAAPAALACAFPERGPATAWTVAAVAVPALAGGALLWAGTREARTLRRVQSLAVGGLLAFAALELAPQASRQLMFFNAFAGGPERGWRLLSVGDDWGQGVPALARMQRERGWPRLNYEPYGTGDPDLHGLRWRGWDGAPLLAWDSRLVAVHVARLTRAPERYWLLDGLQPVAFADGILVFDVPADRLAGPR